MLVIPQRRMRPPILNVAAWPTASYSTRQKVSSGQKMAAALFHAGGLPAVEEDCQYEIMEEFGRTPGPDGEWSDEDIAFLEKVCRERCPFDR